MESDYRIVEEQKKKVEKVETFSMPLENFRVHKP